MLPASCFDAELCAVGSAGSSAMTVVLRTGSCCPWTAPAADRADPTRRGCSLPDQRVGRRSPAVQKCILVVWGESP